MDIENVAKRDPQKRKSCFFFIKKRAKRLIRINFYRNLLPPNRKGIKCPLMQSIELPALKIRKGGDARVAEEARLESA